MSPHLQGIWDKYDSKSCARVETPPETLESIEPPKGKTLKVGFATSAVSGREDQDVDAVWADLRDEAKVRNEAYIEIRRSD